MATAAPDDVNALLTKARGLRQAALATAMPDYRAKLLKLARHLETEATEVDAASGQGPLGKFAQEMPRK